MLRKKHSCFSAPGIVFVAFSMNHIKSNTMNYYQSIDSIKACRPKSGSASKTATSTDFDPGSMSTSSGCFKVAQTSALWFGAETEAQP